jgi:hypothetical protein
MTHYEPIQYDLDGKEDWRKLLLSLPVLSKKVIVTSLIIVN